MPTTAADKALLLESINVPPTEEDDTPSDLVLKSQITVEESEIMDNEEYEQLRVSEKIRHKLQDDFMAGIVQQFWV